MGHSYKVAEKHYLRVQDEEFDRAAKFGATKPDDNKSEINNALRLSDVNDFFPTKKSVLNPVLQAAERNCTTEQQKSKSLNFTGSCNSVQQGATPQIAEAGLGAILITRLTINTCVILEVFAGQNTGHFSEFRQVPASVGKLRHLLFLFGRSSVDVSVAQGDIPPLIPDFVGLTSEYCLSIAAI
jgi:hypothetical protein